MSSAIAYGISEGLPRVLGNKGTWPFIFGEQSDILKLLLGNTGTFEYFSETREY